MTNLYEIEKKKKEYEEAYRKYPFLDKGLGELVLEKDKLLIEDSNVIKPKSEIPRESLENYEKYHLIIKELNLREKEYTRRPYSEIQFS